VGLTGGFACREESSRNGVVENGELSGRGYGVASDAQWRRRE